MDMICVTSSVKRPFMSEHGCSAQRLIRGHRRLRWTRGWLHTSGSNTVDLVVSHPLSLFCYMVVSGSAAFRCHRRGHMWQVGRDLGRQDCHILGIAPSTTWNWKQLGACVVIDRYIGRSILSADICISYVYRHQPFIFADFPFFSIKNPYPSIPITSKACRLLVIH